MPLFSASSVTKDNEIQTDEQSDSQMEMFRVHKISHTLWGGKRKSKNMVSLRVGRSGTGVFEFSGPKLVSYMPYSKMKIVTLLNDKQHFIIKPREMEYHSDLAVHIVGMIRKQVIETMENVGLASEVSRLSTESKLTGTDVNDRLGVKIDNITFDLNSDEGRSIHHFVKKFDIKESKCTDIRIFISKMKKYIIETRAEDLGCPVSEDNESKQQRTMLNILIEESLQRAVFQESILSFVRNQIRTPNFVNREKTFLSNLANTLALKDQNFFQIPPEYQSNSQFITAVNIVNQMNQSIYPYQLASIVMRCVREIKAITERNSKTQKLVLNADVLLPLMIFILSQTSLKEPLYITELLSIFTDPDQMKRELGYYVTLFSSAMTVLENWKDLDDCDSYEDESCISNCDDEDLYFESGITDYGYVKRFEIESQSKERLYCLSIIPTFEDDDTSYRGQVFFSHGLHEHSGRYKELYLTLIKNRYIVHTLDLVGHGRSGGRRGLISNINSLSMDLKALIEHVEKDWNYELDMVPNIGIGFGLGSTIILEAMQVDPKVFHYVCFLSVSTAINQQFHAILQSFSSVISYLMPYKGIAVYHISHDPEVMKQFQKDKFCIQEKLLALTGQTLLKWQGKAKQVCQYVNIPFLILHGKRDHVCSAEGAKMLTDLATSDDKKMKVYENGCHALLHGDCKDEVMEDLVEWMNCKVEDFREYQDEMRESS